MAPRRYAGAPFLAVGVTFLVLGISGNKALLALGLAFVVIAFTSMRRR